jgi:hypothetical protein
VVTVSAGIWPRLVCFALLIILLLGSVLAYIALAMTINGEPPYGTFNGWVAVMQPYGQPSGDQVQLLVQAVTSGQQPLVRYTVGICGSQGFTGDLLIDGNAKLLRTTSVPAFLTEGLIPAEPPIPPASIHHVTVIGGSPADLTGLNYPPTGNFGPLEFARISAPRPVPCGSEGPAVSSVQAYVQGYLDTPIQQNSNGPFGLWRGPNVSQAWPLTGTLPYAGPDVSYSFNGLHIGPALAGQWQFPAHEQVQISGPAAFWSVDAAQPAPTLFSPLTWSSGNPIQPTARLTDSASMNTLQDWIVVAGVGMGIAGSLLAGLIVEALRSRPTVRAARAAPCPRRKEAAQRRAVHRDRRVHRRHRGRQLRRSPAGDRARGRASGRPVPRD